MPVGTSKYCHGSLDRILLEQRTSISSHSNKLRTPDVPRIRLFKGSESLESTGCSLVSRVLKVFERIFHGLGSVEEDMSWYPNEISR